MCAQVYFCVAVFRYLEKSILKHVQEQNLLVFLKVSKQTAYLKTHCVVVVWSGAGVSAVWSGFDTMHLYRGNGSGCGCYGSIHLYTCFCCWQYVQWSSYVVCYASRLVYLYVHCTNWYHFWHFSLAPLLLSSSPPHSFSIPSALIPSSPLPTPSPPYPYPLLTPPHPTPPLPHPNAPGGTILWVFQSRSSTFHAAAREETPACSPKGHERLCITVTPHITLMSACMLWAVIVHVMYCAYCINYCLHVYSLPISKMTTACTRAVTSETVGDYNYSVEMFSTSIMIWITCKCIMILCDTLINYSRHTQPGSFA